VSRRTLVIVDEAYLEFTEDFAERTMATRVVAGDNVVVFRTFAKIYGLAGLPLGYAVMPTVLAAQLRQSGAGDPHALNRIAVKAASIALDDQEFLRMTRDKVAAERARWHATLDGLGLRRTQALANFVFFRTGMPHPQAAAAFRARNVQIGRAFPPLEDWARISIGRSEENSLALSALAGIFGRGSP
jgi:histidinol-phosphate aminotransferase